MIPAPDAMFFTVCPSLVVSCVLLHRSLPLHPGALLLTAVHVLLYMSGSPVVAFMAGVVSPVALSVRTTGSRDH